MALAPNEAEVVTQEVRDKTPSSRQAKNNLFIVQKYNPAQISCAANVSKQAARPDKYSKKYNAAVAAGSVPPVTTPTFWFSIPQNQFISLAYPKAGQKK